MPPNAKAKIVVHKTQKNTPNLDVPAELLTQVPPIYVLPTLVAPCKPAIPSSPSKCHRYMALIKCQHSDCKLHHIRAAQHRMGVGMCIHIAMMHTWFKI